MMWGLAVLIFFARLVDVSLGTLKLKAVMRGHKFQSFVIAFIEVLVYTLAAARAFQYVDKIEVLILYALGYAGGNYLGVLIDEKISKGSIMVTIITEFDQWVLADKLRDCGFGVTTSKSYGMNGSEKVQLTVIVAKKRLPELTTQVKEYDQNAYIIHVDVKNILSNNTSK